MEKSQQNPNLRMDQMLDSANKDFKAAILHQELEENTFKTLKNVCSLMCKQKISTAEKLKLQKKRTKRNSGSEKYNN